MSSLALVQHVRLPTAADLVALKHAVRLVPSVAKYTALLLLLVNARSLPLGWHFRVLYPVAEFVVALQLKKLRLRFSFASRAEKEAALEAWYEARMPVGVNPLRKEWAYQFWASPDECDFLLHLSNSSYPKVLDAVRFRIAMYSFPNLLRCGGWSPLAATHFHFLREIPMFSRYEVRAHVGAWDDKWVWLVARFVKPPPPSKRSKDKGPTTTYDITPTSTSLTESSTSTSDLSTGSELAGVNGAGGNGAGDGGGNREKAPPSATAHALLARAAQTPEADGALVYTVTVAQLCYKIGRRTIPPAVILAANGFSAPLQTNSESASDSSTTDAPTADAGSTLSADADSNFPAGADSRHLRAPHAHWDSTRTLRASIPALTAFYAGGWREERWWEEAVAGCEAERRGRVVV